MNISIKKQHFGWQRIFFGALILVLAIVILNIFQNQTKNYVYSISSPIAQFFEQKGLNISKKLFSFFQFSSIDKEKNDLKEENQKLLLQISFLKEKLRQDKILEEITNIAKGSDFTIVPSRIIGLDTANGFLLINKGEKDGILQDMPLISEQKILYGKVFKVYKNFSQVMMISNSNSVVNVKIYPLDHPIEDQPQKPVYGVARGKGGLSLYLDLVDYSSEIKEGDTLITSALEGIFPEGILVGKIESKGKDDLKPFQTGQISPFLDIHNRDSLFLITNYKQEK